MNFEALNKYGGFYFKLNKEELNPILSCPICFSYFAKPILTSCGHSFCFSCILQHLETSSCCPICRNEVDPSTLCINRPFESLIEYLGKTEIINKTTTSFSLNPFGSAVFTLGKKGDQKIDIKSNKPPFAALSKLRVRNRDENDLFGSVLRPINDATNH